MKFSDMTTLNYSQISILGGIETAKEMVEMAVEIARADGNEIFAKDSRQKSIQKLGYAKRRWVWYAKSPCWDRKSLGRIMAKATALKALYYFALSADPEGSDAKDRTRWLLVDTMGHANYSEKGRLEVSKCLKAHGLVVRMIHRKVMSYSEYMRSAENE